MALDTYFAVLPTDVLDAVVLQLDADTELQDPIRFLRLPHPRTGHPTLFLPRQPKTDASGKQSSVILEVQAVAPPASRSWFVGEEVVSGRSHLVYKSIVPLDTNIESNTSGKDHPSHDYSTLTDSMKREGEETKFRPADDIFEEAAARLAEMTITQASSSRESVSAITTEDIMAFSALGCTTQAMRRLCEMKGRNSSRFTDSAELKVSPPEITDEISVFRYSQRKLMEYLKQKVAVLATPRITEMSRCLIRGLAKHALMDDKHEDLLELGRTRLACDLLAQYLPPDISTELLALYDFKRLDAHIEALQQQRLNLLSANVTITTTNKKDKKSTSTVSEDNSRKRKKETKGSHGVEKLKKANVDGMAKLSTFFVKKAA
ncbi:hypothetical protein ID866_5701 [Astraeus odoratus]|nr:hypothetical protein ID866_5701 [Astraeus odoratus]